MDLSPFIERLKKDTPYRIKFFLRLSLIFNTTYAVLLLCIGMARSSNWFLVMSVYYFALALIRVFLFKQILSSEKVKNTKKEVYAFVFCAYFLLALNLIITTLIFLLINKSEPIAYHEITVIALATYTFTLLTVSIINGIKYLKSEKPVYTAQKIVTLISACVSILTLTNTMLATWGDGNLIFRNTVLSALGGAVCLFIITTSVYMLKQGHILFKSLRK